MKVKEKIMSIFEKAVRQKLRFVSSAGQLTVEDLWDLPLTSTSKANLDDIAKGLYRQLKTSGDEVSFVNTAQKTDETIQLKFDIVKHVIDTRVAENALAATERERKEKRQLLMGLIERKQAEELLSASKDDLQKMLEAI